MLHRGRAGISSLALNQPGLLLPFLKGYCLWYCSVAPARSASLRICLGHLKTQAVPRKFKDLRREQSGVFHNGRVSLHVSTLWFDNATEDKRLCEHFALCKKQSPRNSFQIKTIYFPPLAQLCMMHSGKGIACSCDHSREDLSSSKISTSIQGVVAQRFKLM